MMRLTDLEPFFFRFTATGLQRCDFAEAHAVLFLCPSCFARNGGPVGTHALHIPFERPDVPSAEMPAMPRWEVAGTGLGDLTLAPSIQIHAVPITDETLPEYRDGLCRGWHGYIRCGEVLSA